MMHNPTESLPPTPPPTSITAVLVRAIVILGVATVVAIIATSVLLPDNSELAEKIVLYVGGLTGALMLLLRSSQNAAGIQKVHIDLNSRLSAYMKELAEAERAKGVLQGTVAAGASQQETIATATLEAAHVARTAAEAATVAAAQVVKAGEAAADKVTQAADAAAAKVTEAADAAATVLHAPVADGTLVVEAPATIKVVAPVEEAKG
jgi:hypothetical protein